MTRREFEMTEADLAVILDASKPVMMISPDGIHWPSGPQENANRAWSALGARMGFDAFSVEPVPGKGFQFFTAEPCAAEEVPPH